LPRAGRRPILKGMTRDQDLRAELLRRAERDQAARQEIGAEAHEGMTRVDGENLPWLKQVVADSGWPGRSAVGEDGADAAWLLVQHADRDPGFQGRCLDLLTVAVDQGEATKAQLAFLTDRVLLAEGKPQEFGTQAMARRDQWVVRPLRDPDGVDQRRAAMSLGPLAENLARITARHGPPPPIIIACRECAGSVELWPGDDGDKVNVDCPNCGHSIEIIFGPAVPGSDSR